MGISSTLFGGGGGFGQDNPEFRNFDEYMAAMTRAGMYSQENPAALEAYFGSPAGQEELKRLGYTNVDALMRDAQGYAPNVAGSKQFGALGDEYAQAGAQQGQTFSDLLNQLSGYSGNLTDYGQDFNYSMKDISGIPDQVYADMQEMQEEQAARGFKGALGALGRQYGAKGFKPGSGFEQAEGSGLGRNYLEQLRNISRDVGMQKANSQLDLNKFITQQDLVKQGMQQQANMGRANYLTDLQKYYQNFGLQRAGMQGQLAQQQFQNANTATTNKGAAYEAQNAAAMAPYNYGQNYYGMTGQMTGPEKRKGIFGDILSAAGSVAGAFAGGPLGSAVGSKVGGSIGKGMF